MVNTVVAFLLMTLSTLPFNAIDGAFPGQADFGEGLRLRGDGCCARPKATVGSSDASEAAQGSHSRISASGEIRVNWKAASARFSRCNGRTPFDLM